MRFRGIGFLLFSFLVISCSEKEMDPNDPVKSYAAAKKPYDNEDFEIAIGKLGEFKSRFPYSNFATEAELLLANCHFQLRQFSEATASYQQFIKLHPKHPKTAFAQFRIGESYWADAPEEINREQDLTQRAIAEWTKLVEQHPKSDYAVEAQDYMKKGKRRMAEAQAFIAEFYCRQRIWHACAYRYVTLADQAPSEFSDLLKKALTQASYAFRKMAKNRKEGDDDSNLYYRKMTTAELEAQARALDEKAKVL